MAQAQEKDRKPPISAPAAAAHSPIEGGHEDIPAAAAPGFEEFLTRPAYRRVVTLANGREGARP